MAENSGFFNALRNEDGYDRKYNANDYSENLAVVISNGVLRSINDDLKVTASGMACAVGVGRAWINGHWYHNDSQLDFSAVTAPTGGKRWDRVILRLDRTLQHREVYLMYVQGTAENRPVKPSIVRTDDIYDLVLADVYVDTNATSVVVYDRRADAELCGWVYSVSGDQSFIQSLDTAFYEWFEGAKDTLSSVTLFKRYTQTQTLASASSAVTFNIPQYDADTCFLEVYVNGILDNRHSINGSVITFVGTLVAGTVVTVNVYKSIDGTGIMSVSDEITELQQQFATLDGISKLTYKCTGLNDNIALSQIAQAIIDGSYTVGSLSTAAEAFLTALGGNTYLAALPSDAHINISVAGKLGATTPFAGSGAADNRYKWFSLGQASGGARKVIFDFAKCQKIDIAPSANTSNIIFFGTDLNIRNANVLAHSSGAGCHVTMALGQSAWGTLNIVNCNFVILTTGKAMIADSGNFTDCNLHVKSSGDNAFVIDGKEEGLARLVNCTCFAYVGSSSKIAAVFNVESTQTNAVIIGSNLNCPTVAQQGYQQQFLVRSNSGMTQIYNVVSTMTSTGTAGNRNIVGQIWKTKH